MDGSFLSDRGIWEEEDCLSASFLFEKHYDELLRLARQIRRRRMTHDTYLTGDLLHDAYMKLKQDHEWREKDHFLASIALALRHTLVSHARTRLAAKRGGGVKPESLDDVDPADDHTSAQLDRMLDVNASLEDLAVESPRLVKVIDCRFFAGYTEEETADLLGVTSRTVRRDWEKARAYLKLRFELAGKPNPQPDANA